MSEEISEAKVYCDVCGKCCTSAEGNTMLGQSWVMTSTKLPTEFIQEQLGKYKLNHTYNICWECSLRAWGVKP